MLRTTRALSRMFNISISVDGNISSGKSTLVTKLLEEFPPITATPPDLEVIPEPLEKWCNMKGHNLLKMFYEDPVKNNFLFQHYVQLTRLMDTIKKLKPKADSLDFTGDRARIRLMERSLQNNRYCFIELARKQGDLQEAEHAVLVEWYNWLEKNLDLKLDVIIYLQTNPEVVYSRMKSRGRAEEATVPLEYLTALHETYEDWLVHQNPEDASRKQDVVIVNANQGKDEVFEEAKTLLTEHLKKHRPEIFSQVTHRGLNGVPHCLE